MLTLYSQVWTFCQVTGRFGKSFSGFRQNLHLSEYKQVWGECGHSTVMFLQNYARPQPEFYKDTFNQELIFFTVR